LGVDGPTTEEGAGWRSAHSAGMSGGGKGVHST
jgi:hypothetical protein